MLLCVSARIFYPSRVSLLYRNVDIMVERSIKWLTKTNSELSVVLFLNDGTCCTKINVWVWLHIVSQYWRRYFLYTGYAECTLRTGWEAYKLWLYVFCLLNRKFICAKERQDSQYTCLVIHKFFFLCFFCFHFLPMSVLFVCFFCWFGYVQPVITC